MSLINKKGNIHCMSTKTANSAGDLVGKPPTETKETEKTPVTAKVKKVTAKTETTLKGTSKKASEKVSKTLSDSSTTPTVSKTTKVAASKTSKSTTKSEENSTSAESASPSPTTAATTRNRSARPTGSIRLTSDSRSDVTSRSRSRINVNSPRSNGNNRNSSRRMGSIRPRREQQPEIIEDVSGVLDNSRDGHGILRSALADASHDTYISNSQVRRFKIRPGDVVTGPARKPKDNERYWGLLQVDSINGKTPEEFVKEDRPDFKSLTPVYPDEQIKLETEAEPLSLRMIDMIAPIGKGQRSLIVSPPKAGKTTLLKDIATGVAANHPEIHLMAVLVGERPEEVTDIRRHIATLTKGKGEVAASNFDESAKDQVAAAEVAMERAKRMVEGGKDVVILLDSITRLARAYNLSIPTSGRTLSGGFDPAALFPPKKFFGAARNFEVPGSLTIVGTALVDTGSRMDDLVYEEFKGTGNQEVHLDRQLAERRIYPAINVQRSGTRRDDLMMKPAEYQAVITLHRMLDILNKDDRTQTLINKLKRSKSNKEFLASLKTG